MKNVMTDPFSKIDWKNFYKNTQEFNPENFESYKGKYVVSVNDIKFSGYDNRRTLKISDVCDVENPKNGIYIKHHEKTGWTIIGKILQDWLIWVETFEAHHPEHGLIFGSFDNKVYADSKDCYENFVSSHKYVEWNADDI